MNNFLRKVLLILGSMTLIIGLTFFVPALRGPAAMQIFFQEIAINIILAMALSFVFISGSIDFSLGGIFLLALALVRLWRRTDLALEADLWAQVLAALIIPLLVAGIGSLVGWVVSLRQRYSSLLTIAFALLFGSLGVMIMPDFGPWCEPWFCAEIIIPPSWIIIPSIVVGVLVSAGTIYYYKPDFFWIRPVALTWLMLGLAAFVVYEYQGIPLVMPVAVGALLVGSSFLNHSRPGLQLQAIGSNREAARMAGMPVKGLSILSFGLLGLGAGLAALFEVDLVASEEINSVYFRQIDAFVAMLLGGVAYTGGRGNLVNVALAALFVSSLNQLEWTGMASIWLIVIKSGLILSLIVLEPIARSLFKKPNQG